MSVPRQNVRAKLAQEGCCRICTATSNLTRHHLVPESWFRKNSHVSGRHNPWNIVPLCVYCHRVVDGTNSSIRRREKRRALRATLTAREVGFVVAVRGGDWLDRNYPTTTINHDRSAATWPPSVLARILIRR